MEGSCLERPTTLGTYADLAKDRTQWGKNIYIGDVRVGAWLQTDFPVIKTIGDIYSLGKVLVL